MGITLRHKRLVSSSSVMKMFAYNFSMEDGWSLAQDNAEIRKTVGSAQLHVEAKKNNSMMRYDLI